MTSVQLPAQFRAARLAKYQHSLDAEGRVMKGTKHLRTSAAYRNEPKRSYRKRRLDTAAALDPVPIIDNCDAMEIDVEVDGDQETPIPEKRQRVQRKARAVEVDSDVEPDVEEVEDGVRVELYRDEIICLDHKFNLIATLQAQGRDQGEIHGLLELLSAL